MALPQGFNEFALTDKGALVLGAEHPTGRVGAVALAEAGAKLMIASQEPGTEEMLKETAKAVQAAGGKPPFIQVQNASIRADLRSTIDAAVKRLGGLEAMVVALDAPYYAPAEAADDAAFDRVIEGNLKGVWIACQEGGRAMLQHGGGSIVIVSSVLAERGVPGASLYCAAKGAVANLVRALALEWARQKLRINLLEAGWLAEEGSPALANDEFARSLLKYLPYKRLVQPEELAGALLYLASPASAFVTGEALAVDGGLLCRV
ncbi:MAG TPA: SDR family oxidoreductase [Candidatus Binataceae bacterium]|jgi:NAD(P)-dependent dehydrogenase (short-subunit alcohol dehydrogenase family)|nr:SDR family oxidoreductase [Candidatus Binataceae bacterium]